MGEAKLEEMELGRGGKLEAMWLGLREGWGVS